MRRRLGSILLVISVVLPLAAPVSARADTISVSQVITITATVAPARSIVVNDQGQMIKIYSNTADNVTPRVYVNAAPGPARPLTPALQSQYAAIMARPGNKVGVAIDVPIVGQPRLDARLSKLLSTTISFANRPRLFN